MAGECHLARVPFELDIELEDIEPRSLPNKHAEIRGEASRIIPAALCYSYGG